MESRSDGLLNVVPYKTVDDWAKYAIQRFQAEIEKRKLIDTRGLFNSFRRALRASRGNVEEVMIGFAMRGRFLDMGVGRGMKAYERKTNKMNLIAAKRYGAKVGYVGRQPRRWYAKRKMAETLRLQEVLIRDMGIDVPKWLSGEFSSEMNIKAI